MRQQFESCRSGSALCWWPACFNPQLLLQQPFLCPSCLQAAQCPDEREQPGHCRLHGARWRPLGRLLDVPVPGTAEQAQPADQRMLHHLLPLCRQQRSSQLRPDRPDSAGRSLQRQCHCNQGRRQAQEPVNWRSATHHHRAAVPVSPADAATCLLIGTVAAMMQMPAFAQRAHAGHSLQLLLACSSGTGCNPHPPQLP